MSLFGTDGVRGRFGDHPFTSDGLIRLGAAVAQTLDGATVLAAMDTRFSGPEILNRLLEGMGRRCPVYSLGIAPTPALSYLVARGNWPVGLMITASHNPAQDNGIKLFNSQGEKISDDIEARISTLFARLDAEPSGLDCSGTVKAGTADIGPYLEFLSGEARKADLRGLRLLVDTANGAMSSVAPQILAETGASLVLKAHEPDGANINDGCGSQYPDRLLADAKAVGADWGIAFDGDGDRVLIVDGVNGQVFDGDDILYLLARHRLTRESGFVRTVVGTVMSNLGLEHSLRSLGIELVRADVGDRHVYREMKRLNVELGGEPSGHVIIRSLQRSGDGLLSGLHFFAALSELGISGQDLLRQRLRFPQGLKSIRVDRKPELKSWPALQEIEQAFARETSGRNARLLIRYSGTENKIRVMVEADEPSVVEEWMERFEHFILKTIGEKNETVG